MEAKNNLDNLTQDKDKKPINNTKCASITINKEFYKKAKEHFKSNQLTFSSGVKLALAEYLKRNESKV